jgi:regulatory protein
MDNSTVFDRYYNLSLRYLSYRPRSEKEVFDYLKEKQKKAKNLNDDIIFQIMAKLQEYKFIDDSAFAKFWIEQRTKYKNKPARVIEYELKQKGISQDLIDENLPREEARESDMESAKKLAAKKMDFYRNLDPNKRREKVMNYLLRKGFNYDTIKKAIGN